MPQINAAQLIGLDIDRGAIQQFHRIGEVVKIALDVDILTGSRNRTAGLDAQLDVGMPVARAPGSEKDPELVGFTNLEHHRAGRELPADPNTFAVGDGAGLPGVDERALRNPDRRRPSIHDVQLAGDFILFVDLNAGLRPFQIIPVQRPHPEERRLRFLAVGVGRAGGYHRHGRVQQPNRGPKASPLGASHAAPVDQT